MAQANKKTINIANIATAGLTAGVLMSAAVFALFQASTLTPAYAQQAPTQKWFKICAKQADNDVCNVQYRVVASTGQIVTSVNLFTVTGKINRRIFQVTVPTNRLIPAGVGVKIDKQKENRIPYANCFPDRCTAEIKLDDKLVKVLKSGGEILLTSVNYQQRPSPIKISLKGFTAAYDGPSLNKSELEAKNQELRSQLEKKAEDARKALDDAQKKALE